MRKFFLLGALLPLASPVGAFAIGFEVGIGVWNQDPSGYVSYKAGSFQDFLDVEKNLRYGDKTKPFGRLKIDMPSIIPNIYIMATKSKFSGEGVKDVSFKFGGKTFNANVPFSSSVQLDHLDVALYYGIPGIKTLTSGKLNMELGLNARVINAKLKVSQPSTNIYESKSASIPVPMVYAGVQFKPISLLSLEAEGRGIAYSSNHYYDLIGRLKVKPFGPLFIAGGYRYQEIKIDVSDIKSKVKIKGPFVEAGMEF